MYVRKHRRVICVAGRFFCDRLNGFVCDGLVAAAVTK